MNASSSRRSHDFSFDFANPNSSLGLSVEWERHYWIDDQAFTRALGTTLRAPLSDLLDIAMAVYAADRLGPRSHKGADLSTGWQRKLALRAAVRDPEFWQQRPLSDALVSMLGWLTEDDWSIVFERRAEPGRPAEIEPFLFETPPETPVTVGLFSGGLDSLLGVDHELQAKSKGDLILVSASSSRRLRDIQRRLARRLRLRSNRVRSVRVPFNLTAQTASRRHESSQRSRGFMFLVLGAITADMAGADTLRVYENGVGAINLPYANSQLGTQSSRAMHPATLAEASKFFSLAFGRPFSVENPFMLKTKAELCRGLSDGLKGLIGLTVSCDGFPQRVADKPLCGTCSSCLLRRQALWSAGLSAFDNASAYRFDLLENASVSVERLSPLIYMLSQASTLRRCLSCADKWAELTNHYAPLARVPFDLARNHGPLFESPARNELTNLLRRYAEEWNVFGRRFFPSIVLESGRQSIERISKRGVA